jgi:hypothetical protein
MNYKTLATILFRVLGLSYFVYAFFYGPYMLFAASFTHTFIMSTLLVLTYLAGGASLFLFSKRLAGFVVKGLD